jgi:alginate O-acetyltransferase complex protein AlgJ
VTTPSSEDPRIVEVPSAAGQPSREEIALREVGVTDIAPALARVLVIAFLALIALVPCVQLAWGSDRTPSFRQLLTTVPTAQSLHDFERGLDDSSVVGEWLLPRMQSLLVRVGVGNEQAYLGADGWLFYRPSVDYVTGPPFLDPDVLERRRLGGESWEPEPVPDPMPAIVDFRDRLAARGIELVVVPAPGKSQLFPARLAPSARTARLPLQNPSWPELLARLQRAGVRVFDPAPLLAERAAQYLVTDTHWTPEAMDLVAGALAAELTASGVLPERAPAGFTRREVEVASHGDITRMLKLPADQSLYPEERVTIRPVSGPDGRALEPAADADVLLLGDSFTNVYSVAELGFGTGAGFGETLAFHLQRPVGVLAINAGGAHETRRELRAQLLRGRDRLAGVRVVVWEFAARELAVGTWPILDLPAPGAAVGPRAAAVLSGTVAARAPAPRPGSVPYRDCILAVHLQPVRAVEGSFADGEALVYVWGMRDNVLLDAAQWQEGRTVELRVVPWEEVEARYGSFNRREIDDERLWALRPWWGEVR